MNIIITGAGKGIGFELSKILSIEHKVIALSRNISHLQPNLNLHPISLDLNKTEALTILFEHVKTKFNQTITARSMTSYQGNFSNKNRLSRFSGS